jgi:hypothetical protein
VGTRAGLDDMEKRKFMTFPGLELRPLSCPARSQTLYRLRYPGARYTRTWVPNIVLHCEGTTKFKYIQKQRNYRAEYFVDLNKLTLTPHRLLSILIPEFKTFQKIINICDHIFYPELFSYSACRLLAATSQFDILILHSEILRGHK